MVVVSCLLGASIFGIMPFLLEYTVYLADPISENVCCGLVYFVAMIVAAGGTTMHPLQAQCHGRILTLNVRHPSGHLHDPTLDSDLALRAGWA
jgi:hypothetical protein